MLLLTVPVSLGTPEARVDRPGQTPADLRQLPAPDVPSHQPGECSPGTTPDQRERRESQPKSSLEQEEVGEGEDQGGRANRRAGLSP